MKLTCQSCDQDKDKLSKIRSELIAGYFITMCNTCINRKFEPRFIVILAVNTLGINHAKVKAFIKDQRYCGKAIEATELV